MPSRFQLVLALVVGGYLYGLTGHVAGAQSSSSSSTKKWQGCVDPNNPNDLVTIGKKTTICLVIADGVDWTVPRTYMRVNFQPIADQYSRFLVPQSYQQLLADNGTAVSNIFVGKNITVHASSQTALSFQKRYYDSFKKVYPFLTAIIDVRDGVVQGITWDDATLFCTKKNSNINTFDFAGHVGTKEAFGQPVEGCWIDEAQCTQDMKNSATTCDLLLYVVWTGTDANGKSFLSSAYRFSSFPAQELTARLSQNLPDIPQLPSLNFSFP